MSSLCIFQIQDDDRPMFVLAESFQKALEKWQALIHSENPEEDSLALPLGVVLIARARDILV